MTRFLGAGLCCVGLAACATSRGAAADDDGLAAEAAAPAEWAAWPGTSTDDWRAWPGPRRARAAAGRAAAPHGPGGSPAAHVLSGGRAGAPTWAPWPGSAPTREGAGGASALGQVLAGRAGDFVGASSLRAFTRRLPDDCTGLVRLVYESYGLDVLSGAGLPGDNGVTAMWRLAAAAGALHRGQPGPGDLVFFVETYDRNRNRALDDGLTHVGVVESVDARGTVTFVHRSGQGVTRGRVTPAAPAQRSGDDGAVLNDWLRRRSRHAPAAFTGELFAGYASADALSRAVGNPPPARYSAALP